MTLIPEAIPPQEAGTLPWLTDALAHMDSTLAAMDRYLADPGAEAIELGQLPSPPTAQAAPAAQPERAESIRVVPVPVVVVPGRYYLDASTHNGNQVAYPQTPRQANAGHAAGGVAVQQAAQVQAAATRYTAEGGAGARNHPGFGDLLATTGKQPTPYSDEMAPGARGTPWLED
jgi:hypothetical protein